MDTMENMHEVRFLKIYILYHNIIIIVIIIIVIIIIITTIIYGRKQF